MRYRAHYDAIVMNICQIYDEILEIKQCGKSEYYDSIL